MLACCSQGTAVAISKESIVGGVIFWCAAAACAACGCSAHMLKCVAVCRIALLTPVGVFVFKNAEEGEGPKY